MPVFNEMEEKLRKDLVNLGDPSPWSTPHPKAPAPYAKAKLSTRQMMEEMGISGDVKMDDLKALELAKGVVNSALRVVRAGSFIPEFDDLFDQVEQIIKRRK